MIAVESSKDGNRLQRTANLLIISPEEFAHMYLFAIENSILKGESDEILLRWKKHCLSVCIEYIDIASEGADMESFWYSWNSREVHSVSADAIKRTCCQRACEVHELSRVRALAGLPSTAEALAALYNEKASTKKTIGASDDGQKKSANVIEAPWIRSHLSIYDKVCKNRDIMDLIDRLDKRFGADSCLNSLTKLTRILERCDTVQTRLLVFQAIEDAINNGSSNGKFSKEFLVGSGTGGNASPFVQMVLFRWRCRHHLLTIEMPREHLDQFDLKQIADKTSDYTRFRKFVDIENPTADTQWIGAMNHSSALALRVIQATFMNMNTENSDL